jgi:hypothetical protein
MRPPAVGARATLSERGDARLSESADETSLWVATLRRPCNALTESEAESPL